MLRRLNIPLWLYSIVFFIGFPVCISHDIQDPYVTPRILLVAAAVVVLTAFLLLQKKEPIPAPGILSHALILFLLLAALSILKSLNHGDAWFEWMKTFLGLPVILITAVLAANGNRDLILKFSQCSVFILSSIYAYQWWEFLKHSDLDVVFDLKIHLASTLGNKNFYAEVAVMLLPLSGISVFILNRFWKGLSLFNVVALLTTLLMTKSLAVLLALGFASIVVAGFWFSFSMPKKSFLKLAGLFLLVSGIAVFVAIRSGSMQELNQRAETIQRYLENPALIDSTTKSNSNSAFERMLMWRNSLKLIRDEPVTGCGLANWKLLYPKYGVTGTGYIEGGNVHYEHPHNDFLLIASESGIPALIAWLVFLFAIVWLAVKQMKHDAMNRIWFAGILFAVLCFMISSLFSFPRHRFYAWILLAIQAGVLQSFLPQVQADRKNVFTRMKIVLLLGAVVAAWTLSASIARYRSEVHSRQVQIAKKQGNFARVQREAEKASSWYFPVDETATPFTWYEGMAFFYSGNTKRAKVEYEDALKKNPYHIQLLNDYATACEQSDERERALTFYHRALEITPYFPHSLLNISACYFNLGKMDSAYSFIDKLYGLRLTHQEKKSYQTYLPAILREKIYAEAASFPDSLKETILTNSTNEKLVADVYKSSRLKNIPFEKALIDSLTLH